MELFRADRLLTTPDELLVGGGLLIDDGRIVEVLHDARSVAEQRRVPGVVFRDLGDCLLAPGLVNAHAHLELDMLEIDAGADFMDWIRAVLAQRSSQRPGEIANNLERRARELLASGTTTVGQLDADPASCAIVRGVGLRARSYREVLDGYDAERTPAALELLREPFSADDGLAPHGPHTVSQALLSAIGGLQRAHGLPVTMHWAESREESEWLQAGSGAFARLLTRRPAGGAIDALEAAGLLNSQTSLVHGNHPQAGEPERVADAGCVVIHCPGTHAYFGREPFELERYMRLGVPIALGTDSIASNACLDMRHEMALLRAACPSLAAREVWRMATEHAARALQLPVGRLQPGSMADFCAYAVDARDYDDVLDQLTAESPAVIENWVGAQSVFTLSEATPGSAQA